MSQSRASIQLSNLHLLTCAAAVEVKEQRSGLLVIDKPLGFGRCLAAQAKLLSTKS